MLVFLLFPQYRRRFPKVDAHPVVVAQRRAVEELPDRDRGVDGRVGYDYAAEGAERGEGVKGRGRAQERVDVLEVLGQECGEGVEVLRGILVGPCTGWSEREAYGYEKCV